MACGCNNGDGADGKTPPTWTLDYAQGTAPLLPAAPAEAQPGRATAPVTSPRSGGWWIVWLVVFVLVFRGLDQ